MNFHHYYVGDGDVCSAVSGHCLPTKALTSGSSPSAEALFKESLHKGKGFGDSKLYLQNPNIAEAIAGR
jgi:hypothetical protein